MSNDPVLAKLDKRFKTYPFQYAWFKREAELYAKGLELIGLKEGKRKFASDVIRHMCEMVERYTDLSEYEGDGADV